MLSGEYFSPARVVAFNTAEGWSRDVSEDVAEEIRRRCYLRLAEIPPSFEAFMDDHKNAAASS